MRCFFGVRNNSTFEFGNTGRQGGRGCPFKDVKVLVQVSAKCQPKPIASDLKVGMAKVWDITTMNLALGISIPKD